jgi:GAF domain-containing protein
MTLPDPLVRGWIDSLVERAGAHLRAELGALASQMQVEMRLRDVELGSEPERRGSSATLPDEGTVARLDERQPDLSIVSALLHATTALDQATSLSAVLDVLVNAAAAHASRVLLVVKRGDVLAGWRSAGPAAHDALDTTAIQISLTDDGLVATAARSGQTQVGAGPAAGAGRPAPLESPAVAVPLLVGGRVVAVLFAHEASGSGEHPLPSEWPEVIQVLARHAARCLEVMTVQRLPRLVQARQAVGSSRDDRPSDA